MPARVWKEMFAGLLAYDDVAELGGITAPTLLVWGDADGLVGRDMQEMLAERIGRSGADVRRRTHAPLGGPDPLRWRRRRLRHANTSTGNPRRPGKCTDVGPDRRLGARQPQPPLYREPTRHELVLDVTVSQISRVSGNRGHNTVPVPENAGY